MNAGKDKSVLQPCRGTKEPFLIFFPLRTECKTDIGIYETAALLCVLIEIASSFSVLQNFQHINLAQMIYS